MYNSNESNIFFSMNVSFLLNIRVLDNITCVYDNNEQFYNLFYIIVKPNNLTCIAPVLDHDKETVSITCTATKVFPSANCIFYVDDKIPDYNDNVSVSNVKWTQASEYYTTHCTWISSLSNFHQGIHQFSILMYPVILNETIDTFYGIKAASPALNLS
uniref:Uncharacterized protein n=1 Tax=Biomphalaria glabrata TaxID=6526 RepID=A0A2C9LYT8_BIOGL